MRLSVPLSFLFLSSYFGWYFVNKANSYGQEVGVVDWNVESYILLGSVSLLYALLQFLMIGQFVIHDFSTKLSLYPRENCLKIKSRKYQAIKIHVSDIDSVIIKRLGAKESIYSWGGYCKIELESGDEIYITAAIIRMSELYEFFRIGSKKVVQYRLFAFLPIRGRKTATNNAQPQS